MPMRLGVPETFTQTVELTVPEVDYNMDEEVARQFVIDNGLTMAVGASVTFSIQENPTTGYSWQLDQESANGVFDMTADYIDQTPQGEIETILGEDGMIAQT